MPSTTTNNIAFIPLLWLVGLAIGKGGENIKRVTQTTGAKVRYDQGRKGFVISGDQDQVRLATNKMTKLIEKIKQRGDYKQKAAEAIKDKEDKEKMQVAWKLFCEKLGDDNFPLHSVAELKKLRPKFVENWSNKKLEKELEMDFYATHRTGSRCPRSATGGSATGGSSAPTGLWCRAVAGGSAAAAEAAPATVATAAAELPTPSANALTADERDELMHLRAEKAAAEKKAAEDEAWAAAQSDDDW